MRGVPKGRPTCAACGHLETRHNELGYCRNESCAGECSLSAYDLARRP